MTQSSLLIFMTVHFGLTCISAHHSDAGTQAYGGSDTHVQKTLSRCKHYIGPLYDECLFMGHNCPTFKLGINVMQGINVIQYFSSSFPRLCVQGGMCMHVLQVRSYIELEILIKKCFSSNICFRQCNFAKTRIQVTHSILCCFFFCYYTPLRLSE